MKMMVPNFLRCL